MPRFGSTSRARLDMCDEGIIVVLDRAIETVDFTVLCGHRNKDEQDEAFANGKSTKQWPHSRHNQYPSTAVDIAPWLQEAPHIDWRIDQDLWLSKMHKHVREEILENIKLWYATIYFIIGVGHAMGIELETGSDWNGNFMFKDEKFVDLPHLQLKVNV